MEEQPKVAPGSAKGKREGPAGGSRGKKSRKEYLSRGT